MLIRLWLIYEELVGTVAGMGGNVAVLIAESIRCSGTGLRPLLALRRSPQHPLFPPPPSPVTRVLLHFLDGVGDVFY